MEYYKKRPLLNKYNQMQLKKSDENRLNRKQPGALN